MGPSMAAAKLGRFKSASLKLPGRDLGTMQSDQSAAADWELHPCQLTGRDDKKVRCRGAIPVGIAE